MKSTPLIDGTALQWAQDEARATAQAFKDNKQDEGEAAAWAKLEKDYLDARLFGPEGADAFFLYQKELEETFPKLAGIR